MQAVSEILNGRKQIVADTALAIGEALGTSPQLWLNLQTTFNLVEARSRRPESGDVSRRAAPPVAHPHHRSQRAAGSRIRTTSISWRRLWPTYLACPASTTSRYSLLLLAGQTRRKPSLLNRSPGSDVYASSLALPRGRTVRAGGTERSGLKPGASDPTIRLIWRSSTSG